jgi:hypothetical protein
MTASQPNLLLLGDAEPDNVRAAGVDRQDFVRSSRIRIANDIAALRRIVANEHWFPDLIVVWQTWPDQFLEAEVHELIALCPLARIVCCFGPWCDSDGRTRSIWPLAVRVPAAAARARLERELAVLRQHEPHRALLPLTASRAEIFEFDFDRPTATGTASTTAAVISPDRSWREMIESSLRAAGGIDVHEPQAATRPQAIVFDADPWDADRARVLRAIRAKDDRARIIAAIGFPRLDLEVALRQAGADKVWFKLAPLRELHGELYGGASYTADKGL